MNNTPDTHDDDDDDDDLLGSFNTQLPPKPAQPAAATPAPADQPHSSSASEASSTYTGKAAQASKPGPIPTDHIKLNFPPTEPQRAERKPVLTSIRERLFPPKVVREAQKQSQTGRQTDQNQQGVIMGPARSGKTFLLLAIGRACFLPGRETYDLRFIPEMPSEDSATSNGDPVEKQSVAELMRRAVKIITNEDKNRKGTLQATDYSFGITATGQFPGRFGRVNYVAETLSLTVSDGPGGALFTDEADENASGTEIERWQGHLVSRARRAKSLILCVDATAPQLALLEKQLPVLVDKMAKTFPQLQKVSYEQSLLDRLINLVKSNKLPMRQVKMRCLNVDRFLLLLTKVDRVCATDNRPDLLAARIKPVQTAIQMLGLPFLNMIHQSLKPDAKFAIGVASALGFYPSNGLPLAGDDGFVKSGGQREDDILNIWKPFGVRDAMFFIATGHATGTVKLVNPQDIRDRNHRLV